MVSEDAKVDNDRLHAINISIFGTKQEMLSNYLFSIRHVSVRVVRIRQLLLHTLYRLDHLCRGAQGDRVRGQTLSNHRPSTNSAASANGDTRENNYVATDPAVVLNADGMSELDELDPG